MSRRDVKVKKISNKRARSSLQWVPKVPLAADIDPALMNFSEEEPDEYDPFELGFDVGIPGYSQGVTGGSSSSNSAATWGQVVTIPSSTVVSEIQRERIARSKAAAVSKKAARKSANLVQRKKAIARKIQLKGVGVLTEEQRDLLNGVRQAASSSDPCPNVQAPAVVASAAAVMTLAPRKRTMVEEWELEGFVAQPSKQVKRDPKELFPFILKSLGSKATTAVVSAAKEAAPKGPLEKRDEIEEDSSSSSDGEMELDLDPSMECSFGDFLKNQAAATEDGLQAAACLQPSATPYETELETEKLLDLLDLEEVGEAVTWPEGLDSRVASIIVNARALTKDKEGSKPCG